MLQLAKSLHLFLKWSYLAENKVEKYRKAHSERIPTQPREREVWWKKGIKTRPPTEPN